MAVDSSDNGEELPGQAAWTSADELGNGREPVLELGRGRGQVVGVVVGGVAQRAPALDEVAGEFAVAEQRRQARVHVPRRWRSRETAGRWQSRALGGQAAQRPSARPRASRCAGGR